MKELFSPDIQQIQPTRESVFLAQGIDKSSKPSAKINGLFSSALDLFQQLVEPKGMISSISTSDFSRIYSGIGKNEKDTPLRKIFPLAENLALFVFTLGEKISQKITELFAQKSFALGAMLDSVASRGADVAAQMAEDFYLGFFSSPNKSIDSYQVLLYSPGYCGWHISGQKKLFEYLHPEEINITLNEQFLMIPLKSISGVLVYGKREIHIFKNNFSFCKLCYDHSCVQRMNKMRG